ncbi:hypothetical protein [Streptomyces chattanoogensis]|uniref:hypothetical protein n=1 Tax=Streptomyces chattanoogensis TaxID=66876 RepID=UPI0005D90649|nr:hypothetical protein T261_3356 [Streptomyces lydicus]
MAKEEYRVDLDALDQVVRELNEILRDMGGPRQKAENNTYLAPGALGENFSEQKELYDAHDEMVDHLKHDVIGPLEKLIDDFGQKTKKVKEAYDDSEIANTMK